MSHQQELAALSALAESRRAAGLPCNDRREGVAAVDWLTDSEIQRAHVLGLRIELAGMTA